MASAPKLIYLFGSFRLDTEAHRLLQDERPIDLPPRVFDTLVALVERSGRLVEKDELIRAVWADAFVEEANLTVNVSTLRKALGGSEQGQAYIETVRGRGYRFVAPVTVASAAPGRTRHPTRRRVLAASWILLLALVGSGVAFWGWWARDRGVTEPIGSLAILPFRAIGESGDKELLGLGMADALIVRLSHLRSLAVRSTSSVARYADEREPIAAGRELGTDAVLDGLIQRHGDRVRASLQLIRTANGATLWAETFDQPAAEVFALQDAIAERTAAALMLPLTSAERVSLKRRPTADAAAYDLYLRGLSHWFRWTPEGWEVAREYFERAIEADPNFALAYAGLATAYGVTSFSGPPSLHAARAKQLAQRALELDPDLAEAHLALGPRLFFHEWDWEGAERSYRRALELNPHHAMGWDLLSIHAYATGRAADAVEYAARAHQLDPLSSYLGWDHGEALLFARRYDEAAVVLERTLAREESFFPARFTLALVRESQGDPARAVAEYLSALRRAGADAATESALRTAYESRGFTGFWQERLAQLIAGSSAGYQSKYELATVAARVGRATDALDWLESAYAERAPEMIRLAVDPQLDPLRSEPRFVDLLRRLRLPPALVRGASSRR